ncbi:MAG TPA: hypothetical protein VMW75_09795 [Thermoanaerobaculia bacterium]|nr:hypothetical protein [Thermoanaerobaculia bacterium]
MNEFEISIDEWLGRIHGNAIERVTLAQIELRYGGRSLIQLEDRLARTNRSFANLSAYDLAIWLASNWWRLRWEPERQGVEWRMAHSLAAIGGGYVWPGVTMASDGEQIRVQVRPTRGEEWEPIRYLDSWDLSLSTIDFEATLDSFIEIVLARLAGCRISATDLHLLWEELRTERFDPCITSVRRLEALLGFDAGTAPDPLIDDLLIEAQHEGRAAVDEVVADFAGAAPEVLRKLDDNLRRRGTRLHNEAITALAAHSDAWRVAGLPWQRAATAAQVARKLWNMDGRPVPNSELVRLVGANTTLIINDDMEQVPMGAAKRMSGDENIWTAILRSHQETGRRFELCRLIADGLLAPNDERLLPVTKAKTSRQKFQRSFAQEFLCPFDALMETLGAPSPENPPEDDDIDDAARYFNVSTRVIESMLANHDILPHF